MVYVFGITVDLRCKISVPSVAGHGCHGWAMLPVVLPPRIPGRTASDLLSALILFSTRPNRARF
eukprot:6540783-Lingulodinium_polyedra.AAC.1